MDMTHGFAHCKCICFVSMHGRIICLDIVNIGSVTWNRACFVCTQHAIDFPGIFLFTRFLDLCDKSRLSISTYALPLVPVLLAFCSIFNILFSYKLYTYNYAYRKLCNHGSADCTTKLQPDFCNLDFPGISIRMLLLIITWWITDVLGTWFLPWNPSLLLCRVCFF